jgi:hypothetical protein
MLVKYKCTRQILIRTANIRISHFFNNENIYLILKHIFSMHRSNKFLGRLFRIYYFGIRANNNNLQESSAFYNVYIQVKIDDFRSMRQVYLVINEGNILIFCLLIKLFYIDLNSNILIYGWYKDNT